MALSGTLNTNVKSVSPSNGSLRFTWTATQNIANNTSSVSWKVIFVNTHTNWMWVGSVALNVNGSNYSAPTRVQARNGHQFLSGTTVISHNSDGAKSFSVTLKGAVYDNAQNVSGSTTFTLNTIPRQSNITGLSRYAYSAKIIDLSVTADKPFNQVSWRIGSGSWTTFSVGSRTSHNWGTSGHNPSTSYAFEVQVRNTASGLWSASRKGNFSTARLATATIGNLALTPSTVGSNSNLSCNISTELAGQRVAVDLDVLSSSGTYVQVGRFTAQTAAGARTLVITPAMKTTILNNTKNHSSRTLRVYTHTYWNGANEGAYTSGTSTVTIESGPSKLSSFSYYDSNSTTKGITGDASYIVGDKSTLRADVTGVTDWRGDVITRMTLTVGSKEVSTSMGVTAKAIAMAAPPISGTSVTAILKLYNSRGHVTQLNYTIKGLPYSTPTFVSVNPERENQYEQASWMKATVRSSSLRIGETNKNWATFRYRVKLLPSGAWGSWQAIVSPVQSVSGQTITSTINQYMTVYPNSNEYSVELEAKDVFGTYTSLGTLRKGTALLKFSETLITAGVPIDTT